MIYKVKSVQSKLKYGTDQIDRDQYGNPKYSLILINSEGDEFKVNKSFKKEPEVGQEISGTIEELEGEYGKYNKLTIDRPAFGGGKSSYVPKDETSFYLCNAVNNATELILKRADLMIAMANGDEAKLKEAFKYLSTTNVTQMADDIMEYFDTKKNLKPEDIAKIMDEV